MLHGIRLSKNQCPTRPDELKRMNEIPYASAIGSIMYAMLCTRPDVSFALSCTSIYQSNPDEEQWIAVKAILKYLRMVLMAIQYSSPGLDWYLLVQLRANETSGLVHNMAYMMDPIAEAYGISLILFSSSGVRGH